MHPYLPRGNPLKNGEEPHVLRARERREQHVHLRAHTRRARLLGEYINCWGSALTSFSRYIIRTSFGRNYNLIKLLNSVVGYAFI